MNLELHHFFILVKPGGEVADLLSSLGMSEGTRNKHEGQGTSNRRFNFSNGTLEILWVHDAKEAVDGPGRNMLFPERVGTPTACPFGLIFNRKDNDDLEMPFEGWKYEPDYFQAPWAFHVGSNSKDILEPLCVYMPFVEPGTSIKSVDNGVFRSISKVHILYPILSESISDVLEAVSSADRLSIEHGNEHLMEVTFNENQLGLSKDFRPDIPLIVRW